MYAGRCIAKTGNRSRRERFAVVTIRVAKQSAWNTSVITVPVHLITRRGKVDPEWVEAGTITNVLVNRSWCRGLRNNANDTNAAHWRVRSIRVTLIPVVHLNMKLLTSNRRVRDFDS